MKFIIEHLEPEVSEWCFIEYKHISRIIGKSNLIFTNIFLEKLKKLGEVRKESVVSLNLNNVCVLDPSAKETLKPEDKFDYYVFGGILGDYPAQKRTKRLLSSKLKNVSLRNLSEKQMSTDTAVFVTKKILDGIEDLKFIDEPEIVLKKGEIEERIKLPYRYVLKNNKPLIEKELIEYLKKKEGI